MSIFPNLNTVACISEYFLLYFLHILSQIVLINFDSPFQKITPPQTNGHVPHVSNCRNNIKKSPEITQVVQEVKHELIPKENIEKLTEQVLAKNGSVESTTITISLENQTIKEQKSPLIENNSTADV